MRPHLMCHGVGQPRCAQAHTTMLSELQGSTRTYQDFTPFTHTSQCAPGRKCQPVATTHGCAVEGAGRPGAHLALRWGHSFVNCLHGT